MGATAGGDSLAVARGQGWVLSPLGSLQPSKEPKQSLWTKFKKQVLMTGACQGVRFPETLQLERLSHVLASALTDVCGSCRQAKPDPDPVRFIWGPGRREGRACSSWQSGARGSAAPQSPGWAMLLCVLTGQPLQFCVNFGLGSWQKPGQKQGGGQEDGVWGLTAEPAPAPPSPWGLEGRLPLHLRS